MPIGPLQTVEIPDMQITLSDGTLLSARVWMPDGAVQNPVPAILEFLPYRKRDGTCARDALTHPYFASHGYACLRVDMRGNGDSEGIMDDEYTAQELADAVEVINWIAAQDWCSGTVGMMGISWGGFNALQVAAKQPEPLKAIITLCSTTDRFADDIHYKGGCLLNENLGWGATMFSYSSRAPDRAVVGRKWHDMWMQRLAANPFLSALWLTHQHRDAYWKHGSICEDFSAIKAATLAVGGWGDAYKNTVQTLVENLDAPVKGIIGPWIHKYPHFAMPEPRIGFLQEALRWWDKWLKGIETGVMEDPDLRLFLMQSESPQPWYETRAGHWIDQDFRAAPRKVLHLGKAGLAQDPSPFQTNINCPADTGVDAGEYCAIWAGPDLPGDQQRDDAQSICFDTGLLTDDIAIVGAPNITLTLTSDAPVAQIAVRLNDVHPDGKASRITYGVLNLCHRDSAETPAPMPVGTPVTLTLALDQIAYQVPVGHRLRVSISNAYWPLIWPAPTPTNLTLTAGHISIPLHKDGGKDPDRFERPEAAAPWQIKILRQGSNRREKTTDTKSGLTTLHIVDDFGDVEDLDHGLITGSIAKEWWDIHPDDPLSARGRTHWSDLLQRGDWRLRTETTTEMWSDTTTFHLKARIEAYEGDTLVYEDEMQHSISRNLL